MKKDDFLFSSMRVRLFEKQLLTQAVWNRLIEAADLEAALRALLETRYSDSVHQLAHPEDFEEILTREQRRQSSMVHEISRHAPIERMAHLRYDYHNLKVLTKAVLDGEEREELLFPFGSLYLPEVQDWLRNPMHNPKKTVLERAVEAARVDYAEKGDAQSLDMLLDYAYFEDMIQLAREIGGRFFDKYCKDLADFSNVATVLRAKRQGQNVPLLNQALVPGGRIRREALMLFYRKDSEALIELLKDSRCPQALIEAYEAYVEDDSITAFERAREAHALTLAEEGLSALYGPEVVFGYVVRVETEIQNLRIILNAKRAGISASAIRERMREAHV